MLQCQTGPLHSTVTCQGSHRRGGERLPLGQPYGLALPKTWVLVTPFHLLLGNAPLSTLLNIPPSTFHLTQICPTGSSSYCPHGIWALSPIQMATPLHQLDCTPTSIGSHPKSGPCGATPLKEKGGNASLQSVKRELAGSLCQGFRSSTEGRRGTLQGKPPTFKSQNLTQPDERVLGHDCICQSTWFPNL